MCSQKIDIKDLGVDLLTINAGKIYGPKGVGALYVRQGLELQPMMFGGHQEQSIRPGTENVAGIIGFARGVRTCLQKTRSRKYSFTGFTAKVIKWNLEKYKRY